MIFLLDNLIAGQAILFYIPRCIWLGMEGGMMEFLVTGCTGRVVESAGEKQRSGHNYVRYRVMELQRSNSTSTCISKCVQMRNKFHFHPCQAHIEI